MAELLSHTNGVKRIPLPGLMMNKTDLCCPAPSRRALLRAAACGFPYLALSALANEQSAPGPMAPKPPHFPAKAKRVIFLFMHGGPSSIDTFDPKPRLDQDNGKPLPIKQPLAFAATPPGPLMKSP